MTTGRGMTVAQLIEALREMPQDAEILTHANNHTTGLGANNDQRVAVATYCKETVVVIGNWSGWSIGHWHGSVVPLEPVFQVQTWGEKKGELCRATIRHVPAHRAPRTTYEDVRESWTLDTEATP